MSGWFSFTCKAETIFALDQIIRYKALNKDLISIVKKYDVIRPHLHSTLNWTIIFQSSQRQQIISIDFLTFSDCSFLDYNMICISLIFPTIAISVISFSLESKEKVNIFSLCSFCQSIFAFCEICLRPQKQQYVRFSLSIQCHLVDKRS